MINIQDLHDAAETGNLDRNLAKSLRNMGALTAAELLDLVDTDRAARKVRNANNRAGVRDVAFDDLRGFLVRSGFPGLATRDQDGKVTIAHGGHSVTFPATQTERLGQLVRAMASAYAEQLRSDETPASVVPISKVG